MKTPNAPRQAAVRAAAAMGYINLLELKLLFNISLVVLLVNGQWNQTESEPEFLTPLGNFTVRQGSNVSFTCVVNNLRHYRVAWIKSDSNTTLAIHTYIVSRIRRLSVTHDGKNTWKLHISNVRLDDSGIYTCQMNTDPVRLQSGNLDVIVPPGILYENEPFTHEANEGGKVQLVCRATGAPKPTVKWIRGKGKDIVIRTEDCDNQVVKFVEGERLVLNRVQRTDMGGYLCTVSNGVPPSVSKRIDVQVNFPPNVKAVNQLVVVPVGSHVLLQCTVEAFPTPHNGWHRHDGTNIYESEKYIITEEQLNANTWKMNLTVKNLQLDDFGPFICSSINRMGNSEARIRLQVLNLPTKSTINEEATTLEVTRAVSNKLQIMLLTIQKKNNCSKNKSV